MLMIPLHPSSSLRRSRCAFTLTELLVVIAIIATLAGLAFGVFNRAGQKGKDIHCITNMRLLGIATQLYVADNQTYPAGTFKSGGPYTHWTDALQPYLEKEGVKGADGLTEVFDCPAKTVATPKPEMAYTANPNVMPDVANSSAKQLASHLLVLRPSEVILLADACQLNEKGFVKPFMFSQPGIYNRSESKANDPMPVGADQDGINFAGIRYRHQNNSAAHFVFADGHVAAIKKGDLLYRNTQIAY